MCAFAHGLPVARIVGIGFANRASFADANSFIGLCAHAHALPVARIGAPAKAVPERSAAQCRDEPRLDGEGRIA